MLELVKGLQLADRYTLERPLGRGGEAATWLARDRMTRASVALKIVPADGGASRRLRDEWQTNLRLMHAHIVRAFEFHEDQGVAFYSLQYIDGADLGALAGHALDDILPPLGLLAEALHYAHSKGVVHRDIKAANVLLDYNGIPYLTDFGVASKVGELSGGGAAGTPVAASPQALQGAAAQPADDMFALGVLAYELISGAPPWASPEDRDTAPAPLQSADGEELPQDIRKLVASLLETDASARPTAEQVVAALAAAGFRAGAAHSQIAPRPVVADEQIERVAAVRHTREAPAALSAADPATASGISPRTMGISLAVLVVVLLGVVFLLPTAVDESDDDAALLSPGTEGIAADISADDDVADDDSELGENRVSREYVPENRALDDEEIEFNLNDADYSGLDDEGKLRFKVENVLGELLSYFETLERRGVQRWAPLPYQRAQDFYKTGDDAYLRKNWKVAEVNYLDALTILEPLFDRIEPEFRKALEGAQAAFEAGDRAEALRLFELAVAITPNDPEALAGYERARNLEAVLQLVDSGLAFEEELELDAAESSFKQAVDLDPIWGPAVDGLARVRATRTKLEFDARMSEGFEALMVEDYLSARAAFRMAQKLIPGSPEPADGLLQVDQGLRLQNINTLEREAVALEQSEHWDAAATTYEEILKVDANLAFAIDGLSRARRMSALHTQLDDYIEDPDRLSVPSVMQKATTLAVSITAMDPIGPRLAGQRDELMRLLKRAATPITVEVISDNMTSVSIYRIGVLGKLTSKRLDLRPGTYVAVGARPGFRDVRLEFRVAPEIDMQPVVVRCEEPI